MERLERRVAAENNVSVFVRDNVLPHISPDEPRLTKPALRSAVLDFCGQPDEFWAWCPSREDVISLNAPAPADAHARLWDWDLQLLRRLLDPWPEGWPTILCDLHGLADKTGIALPLNEVAHHPRHDALWNARVFELAAAGRGQVPFPRLE